MADCSCKSTLYICMYPAEILALLFTSIKTHFAPITREFISADQVLVILCTSERMLQDKFILANYFSHFCKDHEREVPASPLVW